ncbi:hemolymph lipopolysaccharide-binding protein isoform X2 [Cephus cinctus]|uniref:Hemolymph lipopolysaccharide-binding protein isoform X2 n=1 Tax=Cephus cinctus TaxID=211228 RepID=A0AAJ7FDC0_CEPCN|nr:hemolymph lipopolysaccharide-binding protein isoform X2 [Cephus cinctus]
MTSATSIFVLIALPWMTVATQDVIVGKLENDTIVQDQGCSNSGQRSIPRDDYEYYACLGSYRLHTRGMAWNDARHTCEQEDGHLAIINSAAEAATLIQFYRKVGTASIIHAATQEFVHIGFHDLYGEGDFVTIHGDSIYKAGYSNWAGGQPDNVGNNENCGSLYFGGGLNDVNCQMKLGFICELKTRVGFE